MRNGFPKFLHILAPLRESGVAGRRIILLFWVFNEFHYTRFWE